jgi:hypothetical protein
LAKIKVLFFYQQPEIAHSATDGTVVVVRHEKVTEITLYRLFLFLKRMAFLVHEHRIIPVSLLSNLNNDDFKGFLSILARLIQDPNDFAEHGLVMRPGFSSKAYK